MPPKDLLALLPGGRLMLFLGSRLLCCVTVPSELTTQGVGPYSRFVPGRGGRHLGGPH